MPDARGGEEPVYACSDPLRGQRHDPLWEGGGARGCSWVRSKRLSASDPGVSDGSGDSGLLLSMLMYKMMVNVWSKFMMENLCAGGQADVS